MSRVKPRATKQRKSNRPLSRLPRRQPQAGQSALERYVGFREVDNGTGMADLGAKQTCPVTRRIQLDAGTRFHLHREKFTGVRSHRGLRAC